MIKIKTNKGKTQLTMKGEKFEVANEAVNIAVNLVERLGDIDEVLGAATKKTIIGVFEGRVQPKEEAEEEK